MRRARNLLVTRLIPAAVLAAVVLLGFAVYADGPKLVESVSGFSLWTLPVAVGFASTNYAVRFIRWHYYLRRLGLEVPPRASAGVFLTGLSMSVTPGKLGELLKCFMLRDRFGIGIARTAPVVIAERYTDVVGVLALVALSATRFSGGGPVLVTGGIVALALLAVLMASDSMVDKAGALLSRTVFRRRELATDWARESGDSFRSLLRGRPLVVGTGLAALAWFLECIAFLVVLRGFSETDVTLLGATFAYATSTLAGALSMLPGGLGVTEGSMAALLSSLGVPRSAAAGATLVIRACTLWWSVLIGVVAYAAHATQARIALTEAESEG